MILPNNGKVVIIDDQPSDVIELIAALSKEKVPFVHYKEEDLSDLPETPIENVRLIFLDLELLTNTYQSAKNITSPIKSRLIRIVKPHTAYALIIWSKKENEYKKALIDDFNNDFSDYKPIFYTSLPKADIIGKEGAIAKIKKELEGEISNFKSFNAFLVWESIVNESSGKLTNKILTLYPPDEEWNNKTKFILYKLALAYSGKAVNSFDDVKKLKNALYTLTLSFTENIENSIDKIIDEKFNHLVSKQEQQIENFTSVINKLLLLSEGSDDVTQPGNLFSPVKMIENRIQKNEAKFSKHKENLSKIPVDKQAEAVQGFEKAFRKEQQIIEEISTSLKKMTNEIVVSALKEEIYSNKEVKDEILAAVLPLELNITPLCDYAQEKAKLFRILPGVLIKSIHYNHINISPTYLYVSDADFRINDTDYRFLFDFRFLYSLDKKEMQEFVVSHRIKQQLLSDIQVKLGAHVNRSGVLFIA